VRDDVRGTAAERRRVFVGTGSSEST
jgi:hypothetical protein